MSVIQRLRLSCPKLQPRTPGSRNPGDRLIPANSWWSELPFYYWKRADQIVGKPW